MKKELLSFGFSGLLLTGAMSVSGYAQNEPASPTPAPTPVPMSRPPRPIGTPAPMMSTALEAAFARAKENVTREQREKAYAKLLEGQRFFEAAKRSGSEPEYQANVRLSRQSFQNAIELDPTLAEAYSAIAELSSLSEGIKIATMATTLSPNSYTAHRILARFYTLKARLTDPNFDKAGAAQAITEWKEVARLDPRGAEAWAYLSEIYAKTGQSVEELEALNKLSDSVAPSRYEFEFFKRATGGQDMSPESSALKLAKALSKAGRDKEAVEVISRKIADEPDNEEAVELLKEAMARTGKESNAQVIQALQQAVYANPANLSLVEALAGVQAEAGSTDAAVKTIQNSIDKADKSDKMSIARLQMMIGGIYTNAGKDRQAIAALESALVTQGIGNEPVVEETDRFLATQVLSSIIQLHKSHQRFDEAKATIERARVVLGKEDAFADLQMLKLLTDSGKKAEALKEIRALRLKTPENEEYFYQEAYILTDLGRVEEAATMIRTKIVNKGKVVTKPDMVSRDIGNYLEISRLYSQAKQGPKAVAAAQAALALAPTDELKQMVTVSLATAQNEAGDFASAEKNLRAVLEKTPANPIALNNLGYFLTERGEKLDEAQQMIQKAVDQQPENPSFLDSLGWAHFKAGKLDEAEKTLMEAHKRDATSSTILDHLGDVYAKKGNMDQAKTYWQKALNLATDNAEVAKLKAKIARKPARN
jgi:tetratricopeptide (TPR) repeat protein